MENVEHGVQTMRSCKSLVMRSYSKFQIWVYVHCAYVYFALVVIDIINFIFIIDDSPFINFHQYLLCSVIKLTRVLIFAVFLLALLAHHVFWILVRRLFFIVLFADIMLRFAIFVALAEVVNVVSVAHSELVVEHPLLILVFWSLQVNFALSSQVIYMFLLHRISGALVLISSISAILVWLTVDASILFIVTVFSSHLIAF